MELPVEMVDTAFVDANRIIQPGVPCPICILNYFLWEATRDRELAHEAENKLYRGK
jgi:hypothetical protein